MEGNEVTAPRKPSGDYNLSEHLDKLCEYYMAMGVPYEEFWFGDYCKLKFYEQKYFHDLEKRNYEIWLQGACVYRAVSVALAQGFGNDRKAKYPTFDEFMGKNPEDGMSEEEMLAFVADQLKKL